MVDFEKEVEKHTENLFNTDLDNYKFKTVFTSISDDIRALLIETGLADGLNINPNLVILTIVSPDADNPCGVCEETKDKLIEWSQTSGYVGDGKARILIVDDFDDKKIWRKLNISFEDAPRHYIFDRNFRLFDIVDGVMDGSYIELFYKKLLNGE